jgi:hypothetical protein
MAPLSIFLPALLLCSLPLPSGIPGDNDHLWRLKVQEVVEKFGDYGLHDTRQYPSLSALYQTNIRRRKTIRISHLRCSHNQIHLCLRRKIAVLLRILDSKVWF